MLVMVLFMPVVAGNIVLESDFHRLPKLTERNNKREKTYTLFDPCNMKKAGNRDVSCAQLRRQGENKNTDHYINPHNPFHVNCDMETNGGGWTIIQRRNPYEYTENLFEKSEDDYEKGFGEAFGSYWIGNANLYALTAFPSNPQVLRIEMTTEAGENITVEYDHFEVGSKTDNYKLTLGNYSGPEDYDALGPHNGNPFMIWSKDYTDNYPGCFTLQSGGWWYNKCFSSNLNGKRFLTDPAKQNRKGLGITWAKKGDKSSDNYSYKLVEMKIRDADLIFCMGNKAN